MPLASWPVVLDEFQTIAKLQEGFSVSRFGDGECALCDHSDYVREAKNATLTTELQQILSTPHAQLIVGIPTMNPAGPKYPNWVRRAPRFLKFLAPNMPYGSAFISRRDSAPWIATPAYAESVERLWRGKRVALVCEPTNKLLPVVHASARTLLHIPCVSHGAYAHLAAYAHAVLRFAPDVAILSHGVSATCLAHRLTQQGVQALDFRIRRRLAGPPAATGGTPRWLSRTRPPMATTPPQR